MSEETYIALQRFPHKGKWVEEGDPVQLAPRAAKYMKLDGKICDEKDKPKPRKPATKK